LVNKKYILVISIINRGSTSCLPISIRRVITLLHWKWRFQRSWARNKSIYMKNYRK